MSKVSVSTVAENISRILNKEVKKIDFEAFKNINRKKIFNTKEIELYEIQIRECEMLLSRSANYITTHNKLITIKYKKTNIKNFGSFKTLVKNERIGRNPKNKVTYKIKSRKSLSFICSKYLAKKISNY